ncbi:sulfite exporter TauE/SafE family protein [Sedimentitalea todarodis]|uniref:Probable membrane transporter protein n=1 Tax=Sedimentitalea todarodis TaxID=1631240 RepID=A0ABU3VI22_9RHOB|nr:sulfite exporter TauE/SafE family protein [Sedimentitalea todarodis]MDU9005841.1 sulfite exporter TauE/SafE family protein [Sedimentitalea todarodis]
MLELSIGFFALAAPAVLFAGISKGGFGSGAAFASASILALILEPGQALAIMLPLLMLIDLTALKSYWGKWNWSDARVLILGGLPGVALGALLFRSADADVLRFLIGAISIGFVVWRFARRNGLIRVSSRKASTPLGLFAGLVTGFTSFVSHAGGPPAAVYLLSQGLTKHQYQATNVLLFWVINIAKFVPYAFLGMFTAQTAFADLLLAPFAILGAWLGVRAHRIVSDTVFFGITYVLLAITGSRLIWDALT